MNMKLIDPSDPLYFNVSSEDPYDRHSYELVAPDGSKVQFDAWESLQRVWFEKIRNWGGYTVTVLDKSKKKKGNPKGF